MFKKLFNVFIITKYFSKRYNNVDEIEPYLNTHNQRRENKQQTQSFSWASETLFIFFPSGCSLGSLDILKSRRSKKSRGPFTHSTTTTHVSV